MFAYRFHSTQPVEAGDNLCITNVQKPKIDEDRRDLASNKFVIASDVK